LRSKSGKRPDVAWALEWLQTLAKEDDEKAARSFLVSLGLPEGTERHREALNNWRAMVRQIQAEKQR